jgi:hypothetical protein
MSLHKENSFEIEICEDLASMAGSIPKAMQQTMTEHGRFSRLTFWPG